MRLIASEWEYRAEGNNNIVFANANSPYLLRLPKACNSGSEIPVTSCNEMEFLENVVYGILDKYSLHFRARKVRVTRQFLEELSLQLRSVTRPKSHCDHKLDETASYGMVMANFCKSVLQVPDINASEGAYNPCVPQSCAPVISIELRPKSCYIPSFLQQPCSFVQGKCFFCLTKIYQRLYQPSKPHTEYCPFDLYSSDKKRMKRALLDFIAGPQRYFSVRINDEVVQFTQFRNESARCGKPVENLDILSAVLNQAYDKGSACRRELESFLSVVCNILQAPIGARVSSSASAICQPHCRREPQRVSLPGETGHTSSSTNVLQLLSDIQSMRDVPINVIKETDEKLQQHLVEHPEDSAIASLDAPYDAELWKTSMCQARHSSCCKAAAEDKSVFLREQAQTETEVFELASRLRRFIVARIFSCCSLILSFQRLQREQADNFQRTSLSRSLKSFIVSDEFDNKYIAAIAILDLYKDPPHQISKYCQRDLKILSNLNRCF